MDMFRTTLVALGAVAAVASYAPQVDAAPVSATLGMAGGAVLAPDPNDSNSATSATFVGTTNFITGTTDLNGIATGLTFTTNTLDFTNFGTFAMSNASFGTFDATSGFILNQNAAFINIFLLGDYTPGSFLPTGDIGPASLSVTLTQNCQAGLCSTTAAFAFASPPATIPEPATLALLGAGLVGLGLARRRRHA